ncbi:MAG: RAMP superfamily CRISPR-associated protein [Candidatus Helarchaeota archaeon]
MKILDFYLIIESVSTGTDIYSRFGRSQGIQDQQTLSSFIKLGRVPGSTIRGWVRHAMEKMLLTDGVSVCHPLPENTITASKNKERFLRDLEMGYHPRGKCKSKGGCLIYNLFGDVHEPSNIIIPSIFFYPAKSANNFKQFQKFFTMGSGRLEIERRSPRVRYSSTGVYLCSETIVGVAIESPFRIILRNDSDSDSELYELVLLQTFKFIAKKMSEYDYLHLLGGNRSSGFGRAIILKTTDGSVKRGIIGISKQEWKNLDKKYQDIIVKERKKFPINKDGEKN